MKASTITGVVLVAATSVSASDILSSSEDFSSFGWVSQSTWIVGTFDGIADIQSDGSESLSVGSGPYDLNWNGNPYLDAALYNNGGNERTRIIFYEGYEWTFFSGVFSTAWDRNHDAQVSFTFRNTETEESTTRWSDLTRNYDLLAPLEFSLEHTFNQIEIEGAYVVMDNLLVTLFDQDNDGIADVDDNCDLYNPDQTDCNENGVGDVCDIADGMSDDVDGSGIPDECECLPDLSDDGLVDAADLGILLAFWSNPDGFPQADLNGDGNIDGGDLGLLILNWGPCP